MRAPLCVLYLHTRIAAVVIRWGLLVAQSKALLLWGPLQWSQYPRCTFAHEKKCMQGFIFVACGPLDWFYYCARVLAINWEVSLIYWLNLVWWQCCNGRLYVFLLLLFFVCVKCVCRQRSGFALLEMSFYVIALSCLRSEFWLVRLFICTMCVCFSRHMLKVFFSFAL